MHLTKPLVTPLAGARAAPTDFAGKTDGMRQRFETEVYLMRINGGRSVRLLNATMLAAKEAEDDH